MGAEARGLWRWSVPVTPDGDLPWAAGRAPGASVRVSVHRSGGEGETARLTVWVCVCVCGWQDCLLLVKQPVSTSPATTQLPGARVFICRQDPGRLETNYVPKSLPVPPSGTCASVHLYSAARGPGLKEGKGQHLWDPRSSDTALE